MPISFVIHSAQHNITEQPPSKHEWLEDFPKVDSSRPHQRRLNDTIPNPLVVNHSLPLMTVQLPNSSSSDPSAQSSTSSAENAPFRHLCIISTCLLWCCNLATEQFCKLFKNQGTAIFTGQTPFQASQQYRKPPKAPRTPCRKSPPPSSSMMQRSKSPAAQLSAKYSLRTVSQSLFKNETWRADRRGL